MSSFQTNVYVGRFYNCKGKRYVVAELVKIQIDFEEDFFIKAVVFREVENNDGVKICLELQQFIENFIPETLEIGDEVEAISMGRSKGVLKVSSIDYASESPYCVSFEGRSYKAKLKINPLTTEVEVNLPEQATDYIYFRPKDESKTTILNRSLAAFDKMQDILNEAAEKIQEIVNKDKIE